MEAANPDQLEDASLTLSFRAIFISDVHLGTASCQAARLLDFLRHTDSRDLYLVGDIIDGWQLKRRWFWNQRHNDVIQKVLPNPPNAPPPPSTPATPTHPLPPSP